MRGPATPYEWRKGTLEGFNAQIESLQRERDSIDERLTEVIKLRDALKAVELKRPYKVQELVDAPEKKKRKMSPEGLKAVRAANKKMWAKRRKEKKA